MAEENVEIVRRAFATFNQRDKVAWMADFDPECEAFPPAEWPENAPIRGAEACWDFYVDNVEAFREGSFELREVRDAGHDRVIANQHREMRGRTSGAAVVYDFWVVITLRHGKHVRWDWFSTRSEALEAAGLSE
jgi:ketosteroid isomerase-like protein